MVTKGRSELLELACAQATTSVVSEVSLIAIVGGRVYQIFRSDALRCDR